MSAIMAVVLLAYVILCGAIAYIGDLLGRRMGKKRLSLFNLRPRHTAVLITSVIGGGIAVATILLMVIATQGSRDLVLRADQVVFRMRENERQLKLGQAEKQRLQTELLSLQKQKQDELARLNLQIDRLDEKLASAENNLTSAQGSLQDKLLEVTNLKAQRDDLDKQRRQLVDTNREKESDIQLNINIIDAQNRTIDQQKGQLAILVSDSEKQSAINEDISEQNLDLMSENTQLLSANKTLSDQRTQLENEIRQLESQNIALVSENDRLVKEREGLLDSVRSAQARYKSMSGNLSLVRQGRIAFEIGEEVYRKSVMGGMEASVLERDIRRFLSDARNVAESRGVKGVNGKFVQIATYKSADGEEIEEEESIKALAAELQRTPGEVLLVANSVINAIEDDVVLIKIQPYTNKLVFRENQEIGRVKLNPRERSNTLLNTLIGFLRQDINEKSRKAGLIPIQTGDGTLAPVGEIDGLELMGFLEKLRALGRTVEVSAVAASDTYSSGPLKVRLQIISSSPL